MSFLVMWYESSFTKYNHNNNSEKIHKNDVSYEKKHGQIFIFHTKFIFLIWKVWIKKKSKINKDDYIILHSY